MCDDGVWAGPPLRQEVVATQRRTGVWLLSAVRALLSGLSCNVCSPNSGLLSHMSRSEGRVYHCEWHAGAASGRCARAPTALLPRSLGGGLCAVCAPRARAPARLSSGAESPGRRRVTRVWKHLYAYQPPALVADQNHSHLGQTTTRNSHVLDGGSAVALRPAADSAAWSCADSRRSSFTTVASASGLTPFSVRPTRVDSSSLSRPVCSKREMSKRTARREAR